MGWRNIAYVDISGYFLETDYNKGDIHIKTEGAMVTLLEGIGLSYYKDLIYLDIRGKKCMYVESNKTIYSTL